MSLTSSLVRSPENEQTFICISEYDEDVSSKSTLGLPNYDNTGKSMAQSGSMFEIPAPRYVGYRSMRNDDKSRVTENQKKVRAYNTYQLEPAVKFQCSLVANIIKDVLTEHLRDRTYQSPMCSSLSKFLAQEIKEKVKELNYKRYKLVSLVTIGEKTNQCLLAASRCVWDTNWDTFATGSFENSTLYAYGAVYAVYYE